MNLEQAKTKLDSISKSTATKNPKTLITELCAVVKFLFEEIDRIDNKPVLTIQRRSPPPITDFPPPPIPGATPDAPPSVGLPLINPNEVSPFKYKDPDRKTNAGDLE